MYIVQVDIHVTRISKKAYFKLNYLVSNINLDKTRNYLYKALQPELVSTGK